MKSLKEIRGEKEKIMPKDSTEVSITCAICGQEVDFYVLAPYGSIYDGSPICAKCIDRTALAERTEGPSEEGKERRISLFECMMSVIKNSYCRKKRKCIYPNQCEEVEREIKAILGNPAPGEEER
jgi:hypothetical protein